LREDRKTSFFEIGNILRFLGLLPAISFVLSICYEGLFYFHLGTNYLHFYEIADYLRITVVFILPSLIPAIIGTFIGASNYESPGSRLEGILNRVVYWNILILATFSFSLILLFGGPNHAKTLSVAIVVIFSGQLVLKYGVARGANMAVATFSYFVFFTIMLFSFVGFEEAEKIRFGKIDSRLRVNVNQIEFSSEFNSNLYLVRSLSTGVIVLNSDRKLMFIPRNSVASVESQIDTSRWRGIFCEVFDSCEFGRYLRE